ncbi:MAG: TatD family deoxyribonuclease [Acidobacteria bacterium]|nr:TatD family deoxyribonuclease [Acidobacteriota bacterium]
MIDSHCHLADDQFEADLDAVVARARDAGVAGALTILDATSESEAARADRVASAWPAVRFALGVHPHQAAAFIDNPEGAVTLVGDAYAARADAVAIGEIGLDYHYDFAPRLTQIEVFRRQIALARELRRPVVIHTREADDDTIDALRSEGGGEVTGVFHCFTGDVAFARRALDLGFHVSFSGIVTFRSAGAIREAATIVPRDRLLIETDSPYLAPVPFRGKRNEPARVAHVLEAVAETRGAGIEATADATTLNYARLFCPTGT